MDRFQRKFRAVATVMIDESFTRHFCGSHNPLKSWRNSPRHSQITWPIGLGGYSSVRIQKNIRSSPWQSCTTISRDAMSILSRRHCSMCSKHIQKHAKTLGRGTKVKGPVPAGRQVGTKSTCNEGKGMRKRETFRTTEGNIFFSNILL